MRDVTVMVELLAKMDQAQDGAILLPNTYGGKNAFQRHQAELLSDVRLAEWTGESRIRITNAGHDFLSAVDQDRPKYIDKCTEYLKKGTPLLEAVAAIVAIVSGGQ